MYRLIALDMDGTLLNEKKQITERTKKAIQIVREKGVTVVLSTGRPIAGVNRYLEELDMLTENDFVLSFNGALVQKTRSKEVISNVTVKGKDLKYLYNISREIGVNIHAFSEKEGLITPKASRYTDVEAEINNISYSIADFTSREDDEAIVKIMMIDEPDVLEEAMKKLPEEVYQKYTVIRSAPFFLEFMNKKANKGVGLELLADYLKINREEVIAIGDAGNDLHMIEYAGLGVAMENAFQEVKDKANYITDSNEEDGVAKVIEKFVLKIN